MADPRRTAQSAERAISRARGAFTDGRVENWVFKHKQLTSLFAALQQSGPGVGARLKIDDAHNTFDRCTREVRYCMEMLIELAQGLPKRHESAVLKKESHRIMIADVREKRQGLGVIAVIPTSNHPFSSWVIPLATAIVDGNAAIVFFSGSLYSIMAPIIEELFLTMDQEAYQFLPQHYDPNSVIPTVAAVINADWTLPRTIKRGAEPTHGPNAIIIDQTIMPSTWSANDKELNRVSQDVVERMVDVIVQAATLSASSVVPSSSAPTFVLVHENIAEGFFQAIKDSNQGNEHLKQVSEDVLECRELIKTASPGGLNFLPVFKVSSFDHAIDFIENEIPSGIATYVFSNARFGAYGFESLSSVPHVFMNDLPERFLVLGPYIDPRAFTLQSRRSFFPRAQAVRQKYPDNQQLVISRLVLKPLKRVPGHRIDFFGGSFLLTAGLTLSTVVGALGWGVFIAGTKLYNRYGSLGSGRF